MKVIFMPYISQASRPAIDNFLQIEILNLSEVSDGPIAIPQNAGELNYAISMLCVGDNFEWDTFNRVHEVCQAYLRDKEFRYQRVNDVLGALDGAFREYRRRVSRSPSRINFIQLVLRSVADEIYASTVGGYEDEKISENGDLPYDKIS